MAKLSWQMTVLYLLSGEESRLGMQDYWNHVFLPGKVPSKRKLMEIVKALWVIILSVCMAAAISLL